MPAPTVLKLNFCRDRRPRLSVSYEKTASLFISETVFLLYLISFISYGVVWYTK